jgi:hypothetical protein
MRQRDRQQMKVSESRLKKRELNLDAVLVAVGAPHLREKIEFAAQALGGFAVEVNGAERRLPGVRGVSAPRARRGRGGSRRR